MICEANQVGLLCLKALYRKVKASQWQAKAPIKPIAKPKTKEGAFGWKNMRQIV
ncbi:MAG: hypothetical protein HYT88_03410 [Candidatus Omnitrophica bacterium]|nr:hypothetical protein [Candidatus Omnitrophota bacterium]